MRTGAQKTSNEARKIRREMMRAMAFLVVCASPVLYIDIKTGRYRARGRMRVVLWAHIS